MRELQDETLPAVHAERLESVEIEERHEKKPGTYNAMIRRERRAAAFCHKHDARKGAA